MDDAQLQEAYMRMERVKMQLEHLEDQQNYINKAIQEHELAKETYAKYNKGKVGDEIIVPIGAGAFVFSKISDNKNALLDIGKDIIVKNSIADAIKILDGRVDDLKQGLEKITDLILKTRSSMEKMTMELQSSMKE